METKQCSRCKEVKSIKEFAWIEGRKSKVREIGARNAN